jgi:uncharacterized membrane protein
VITDAKASATMHALNERASLVAVLVCFGGRKRAARARRDLESELRSSGNVVLDTTVLQIDAKQKASVFDPHRVVAGALTSALTWGLFGFVSGGVVSLLVSAALGALFGAQAARAHGHHVTGRQLERLGKQLPASSSALLTFTESRDVQGVPTAAAGQQPSTVSVAAISDDLGVRIVTEPEDDRAVGDSTRRLRMLLLRYPDIAAARRVAAKVASDREDGPRVELVIETDASGRRRVTDPTLGVHAVAAYDVRMWGGFGLVCGALAGVTGGGGIVGFLGGGVVTGIVWGLFGLGAGALYGLWAGRAISARRLKGIAPMLEPGTSVLLAWDDKAPSDPVDDALTATAGTERLVLTFRPVAHGAMLEAP